MSGTKRSLSSLYTLLADNTAGDISAQDVRDLAASTFLLDSTETSITGTATATLDAMHVCSGTSVDYTVTLPTAVGNAGRMMAFRMSNALTKLVTLDGNSTETIDEATTRVMWAGESATLISDGAQWCKIAGRTIAMQAMIRATSAQTITHNTFGTLDLPETVVNVGSMADAANDQVVIRRAGNYFCFGNFSVASTSAGSGTLIGCVLHNSASLRVGRAFTSTSNSFSVSGGVQIVGAATDTVRGQRYYFDSASINRATEYIDPDSKCFLIVSEIPAW